MEQSQLAVDLAAEQCRAGLVDFLSVLEAQGELYSNEAQLVQSQTSVTTDVIALYRALGGGWSEGGVVSGNIRNPLNKGVVSRAGLGHGIGTKAGG